MVCEVCVSTVLIFSGVRTGGGGLLYSKGWDERFFGLLLVVVVEKVLVGTMVSMRASSL